MGYNYFEDSQINTLPCGIVAFSNHAPWNIIYANNMYFSNFSNNNTKTLNIFQEDAPRLNSLMPRLRESESANLLYRAPMGTGEQRIVMTASKYGEDALLGVLWDATDRSKMIDEVQKEKEKFAMALCNSKNVVFEHNVSKRAYVFYVPNLEMNTVDTIRQENVEQMIPPEAIHPDDREFFLNNILNPAENTLAARMKMPFDDHYKWYRVNRQFEFEDDGSVKRIFGVMVDIDDEKRKEKERLEENEIDPNLEIYHRNPAVKRINSYLKGNPERRDYALFVMDIDNFKNINDSYGHLYGDTVIEMVAHVLKDIRPSFSIPGRYGGDEFFIFVYAADEKEVKQTADNILLKLLECRLPDGSSVSCSIGISVGESFDVTPDYKAMFEKSDKALYAAKKNGKSQWKLFDPEMENDSGRAIDYEVDDEQTPLAVESKDLMKVFLELSSSAKTSEAAIYSIIKYIITKFDFDWMQVMQVNSTDDLITVRYEWSRDSEFHNNAGKSGYYVHSDIMRFRDHFEKNSVFEVNDKNTEGFSPKFQREFDKNRDFNIIYISDTTSDENFYMFTCIRFNKDQEWTDEETSGLNVATKIMTMFISQEGKESERELELLKLVEYDTKTGLFRLDKFYEQLGRLRKLATENDEDVILLHIDIGNLIEFNSKFGYRTGDDLISEIGRFMSNTDPQHSVATRMDGSDVFLRAFRVKKDDMTIIDKCLSEHDIFCNDIKNKYPGSNIVLRTGLYRLKPNVDGGIGFDKALMAKKQVKDRNRNFAVWYTDEE